jgi:phosphopantothenoylcysteine synthetase/decarboxylase
MSNASSIRCLITAGPTREFIDPVRFLSNPSTGKMGYAIAEAAVGGRLIWSLARSRSKSRMMSFYTRWSALRKCFSTSMRCLMPAMF